MGREERKGRGQRGMIFILNRRREGRKEKEYDWIVFIVFALSVWLPFL